jgi:hypothetical protein
LPYIENVRRACILILVIAGPIHAAPSFYRDVLPILQRRCQECHRPGEIAPMPFVSYRETRPWAKAIRDAVQRRAMPPWFADPCCGKFANDRTLSQYEIDTLTAWSGSGASAGDEKDAPPPRAWPADSNLAGANLVLRMPRAFDVPAKGAVEYQHFLIPTGFTADRWIQGVEVRPGARALVHHIVVYMIEPGEDWKRAPSQSDMLTVYAPGSSPDVSPPGMAKLIKAGSSLLLEIHYTPNGRAASDRTAVAMAFAASPPEKRVLTLQMASDRFTIAPSDANAHVTVSGTLPNDALLLGFFPHMHLRGKVFEYNRILDDGRPETLFRASHYNFHWQMFYRLAEPIPLSKGTRLSFTAWYDNSANNPLNPDPAAEVCYGQQSWEEMMVGFFDVAVDPKFDRKSFFVRE